MSANDTSRCFFCDRPAIKTTWVAGVGTVGDCGRAHTPRIERGAPVGRNAPCPCGSGKKFKRCCNDPASRSVTPEEGEGDTSPKWPT